MKEKEIPGSTKEKKEGKTTRTDGPGSLNDSLVSDTRAYVVEVTML